MKTKLFTLLFAVAASVGTMFAEKVKIGDLYYNLYAVNKTAEVTYEEQWDNANYSGLTTANIPSSVDYESVTYSVTSIGDYAFRDCTGLTSVTIPNSVTEIGVGAFSGCTGLTTVTIPNSVTKIGYRAFSYCTGLTSIIIGNSVTAISDEAFWACTGLTSITIPNSVTSIGEAAFSGCTGLTTVTIPNSVTSIGEGAFQACSSLTSVTIPNSVTEIGVGAFLNIPCIIYAGNATGSPWGAQKIIKGSYIENEWVYVDDTKKSIAGYLGEETEIIIPNNVTAIEPHALEDMLSITSVSLPQTIKTIGDSAFRHCSNLQKIICYSKRIPQVSEHTFDYVDMSNCILYVLADCVNKYVDDYYWGDFMDIRPLSAKDVETTVINAVTTENSVDIEWPAVTGATVYTIEIRKDGELVCTLSFNESGQLLNISFAKLANKTGQSRTALQTSTGWKYTITGLDSGTEYTYTVIAKNGETELFNESKSFTTTGGQGIDEIVNRKSSNRKLVIGGHLYILRDGHMYTIQGQEIR